MTAEILEAHLYTYKAQCKRVVDGDTLDLNLDLGLGVHSHQRVRLSGIDTPETYGVKKDSEEFAAGLRAKEAVEKALFARDIQNKFTIPRDIWVETRKDKTGKYGRYLAVIWFKAHGEVLSLNEHLVKEGFAVEREY